MRCYLQIIKLCFLIFSSHVILSQNASLVWVKQFGGGTSEQVFSVAVDAAGNVYSTGYFFGTTDFDPGPGTFTLMASGGSEVFVTKLDALGNFVWAKQLGGNGADYARSLVLDASANVYISGWFQGTADFDPGAASYNLSAFGLDDAFISKLDAAGNFIWAKQIGGTASDFAYHIAIDATANVYVTGDFQNTADFDPGVGTYTMNSSGAEDIFVLKLDVAGNLVWAKQMGGVSSDYGRAITVDALGNVYTTGSFQGIADFDPALTSYTMSAVFADDIFISKLNSSGNFVWAKQLGGISNEYAWSIKVDPTGNVYSTGYFSSTVDFDPGPGNYNLSSVTGIEDIYILKLDASGNFSWAKRIGDTSSDVGFSLALDALSNVFVTGVFGGLVDFDPGPGVFYLNTITGNFDAFVLKLDALGNFIWVKGYGGPSTEYSNSVALDLSGNIYTGGMFTGPTDFDPNAATYTLSSGGLYDAFVHKMGSCAMITSTITAQNNILCYSGTSGGATLSASGGSGFTYTWSPTIGNTPALNNLVAGTYSCIISNSCAYSSLQTVTITQPPAITLTAVANNTVVCVGNSSTLTAMATGGTGSFTYLWSVLSNSNVAVVNPNSNTIYSVQVSDANACTKSQTLSVATSSVYPVISVNSGFICLGASFTIHPSGASTYTIQGGSFVVSPSISTTYTVSGTSSLGCTAQAFAIANISVDQYPTVSVNSGSVCQGQVFTMIPSGANTYVFQGGSATVAPTVNTSYTVIGISQGGCISQGFATSNITVLVSPTVTVNSGSICSGQSFTILPSGAVSYTYQGGSSVVSPIGNTGYTVIGSNAAGCINTNLALCQVSVSPSPVITIVSNSIEICSGESVTLSASGANSYTWSTNSNSSQIIVSPLITTTYSIIGTGINSCEGSNLFTQLVTVCTDIKQIDLGSNQISFFPNPFSSILLVKVASGKGKLQVFDGFGSEIFFTKIESEITEIDMRPYASGIYFVKVESVIKKLIKQ